MQATTPNTGGWVEEASSQHITPGHTTGVPMACALVPKPAQPTKAR
eukprot:CAMPEP_0179881994 /NCGR_PEP_ID=MMETSP0982-20121206/27872_1 /TAXON_ID=483367 /ORGANISM="non described non described, Strain CCMP 2436" /LENGTH=45 /DNA_ID= /DNA_START= /DNA_END= /DNA_ORIENTATION=